MIISAPENSVIMIDGETRICNGTNLKFDEKKCVTVFYPDDALPSTVVFNGDKIYKPSEVYTVRYPDDIALCFTKRKVYRSFTLIAQKSLQGVSVTAYGDGGLKVAIELQNNFAEIFSYPFYSQNAEIYIENFGYSAVVCVFFSDIQKATAYHLSDGKVTQIYSGNCNEVLLNTTLTITEIVSDIARHEIKKEFSFFNGIKNSVSVKPINPTDLYDLPHEVLSVAFLEEIAIGGNCDFFLAQNLKEKSTLLPEYLGKFMKVIPMQNGCDELGLLYPSDFEEYDFIIKRCKVEFENYKVKNIKLLD